MKFPRRFLFGLYIALILTGCQTSSGLMIYDENLEIPIEINKPFSGSEVGCALPKHLNWKLPETIGKKISDLDVFESGGSVNKLFCKREFFDYDIYGYSEEFNFDPSINLYGVTKGYLLTVKNEMIISALKIFEYELLNSKIRSALLLKDHLIIIDQINHSYDVVIEGKDEEIDTWYVVFEFLNNAEMKVLEEKEGKTLLDEYLRDNQVLRNLLF